MHSHKTRFAFGIVDVCTVAFALILCDCAAATTLARLSIEQMASAATTIARGRCVTNESRWEKGEIWTISTLEIEDVWKGAAGARISVRLIGGHSGHFISTVSGVPRFHPGEEVVLFLEPAQDGAFTVAGWMQGTFRIGRDPHSGAERVTQDSAGFAGFDPTVHEIQDGGIRNLPIEQFRARVRAAGDSSGRAR
jgi:hypothetical protein